MLHFVYAYLSRLAHYVNLDLSALELGGIEFTSEALALSRCEIFTSFLLHLIDR